MMDGKIVMTPRQVAGLLHKELGTPREELVLKVLRYTIDEKGVLKNPQGKKVGSVNRQGYKKIQVTICGKARDVFLHRIQAYNKYGSKLYEKGIQVRHLNDIKTDNSSDNIALGTATDNLNDRGREKIMADQKKATDASKKYSDEKVLQIKEFYKKNNNSQKLTMQTFNISSTGTLWYILNKR